MEFFTGFKWAVPKGFADAVALCKFEEGDILYDTEKAYSGTWKESLKFINYHIEVMYPKRAIAGNVAENKGVFGANWNSEVRINLYTKGINKKIGQIYTTQGRLFTVLWNGDLTRLYSNTRSPEIPINVREVSKLVGKINRSHVDDLAFVMAYDCSNNVSNNKYFNIYEKLKSHLSNKPILITPEESGLNNWENFSPTVQIAIFSVNGITKKTLENLIKSAVYRPAKNSKADMFRIKSHGVIFGVNSE